MEMSAPLTGQSNPLKRQYASTFNSSLSSNPDGREHAIVRKSSRDSNMSPDKSNVHSTSGENLLKEGKRYNNAMSNTREATKPEARHIRSGSLRKHNFMFGKLLGEGAYSRVFHAKIKHSNKHFAVKIMDKAFIKKENKVAFVLAERRILMRLAHPHIVRIHLSFTCPDRLYIVMDLCRAELLHAIIFASELQELNDCAMSVEDTCFYIAEIVDALEYLHTMRIVHRDLKPENILIDAEGHIKIADFGTALDLSDDNSNTQAKTAFVGTAQYISPEVLDDEVASFASDIWALGCTMFQCLVGRPIFQGNNDFHTFQLIQSFPNEDSFIWPAMDTRARDIILKFLKQQPSERLGVKSYDDIRSHSFFSGAVSRGRVVWGHMRTVAPPSQQPPILSQPLAEPTFDGARDDWEIEEVFQ